MNPRKGNALFYISLKGVKIDLIGRDMINIVSTNQITN
jgi:hypothetical protein